MTDVVLFDLDGTLLQTNLDSFLPAYFDALDKALHQVAPPNRVASQIKIAVDAMTANDNPGRMLDEIFAEHFYQPLGVTSEDCHQIIAAFYAEDFPDLKSYTQVDAAAQPIVEDCLQSGMRLAIATNPLFPEAATHQRILWAGLNPQDFVYYSTYDHFHFTKPNLTYYAECMGRLGWPEQPPYMIGDSQELDIEPAQALGWPAFHVDRSDHPALPSSGRLSDARIWLQRQRLAEPQPMVESFAVNQATLRSTPAILDSWIKFHPEIKHQQNRTSKHWHFTEIVWYLADMEREVYLPQWEQLQSNPATLFMQPDIQHGLGERDYANREIQEGWSLFLNSRLKSLALIDELQQQQLLEVEVEQTAHKRTTVDGLICYAARHDRKLIGECYALLEL